MQLLELHPPREAHEDDKETATTATVSTEPKHGTRRLVIGGSVVGGIGLVAVGIMGGGIAIWNDANADWSAASGDKDEIEARAKRGSGLAISMGIIGAAAIAAGAALLAVGLQRRQASRGTASLRVGPTGVVGRF